LLLSLLSNRVVSDTASGMRVIRRDALPLLYPLPDGLQFTPAMSARVLMDDRLKIIECPMPYEERVGQSKLHVARDGVRFLRAILGMTLAWRPARVFLSTAAIGATIMTLLAVHPVEMWVTTGKLREDMIYRLLFCSWLGALAAMLVSASMICECVTRRWRDDARPKTFLGHLLRQCYASSGLVLSGLLMLPLVGWLIGPGIWSYFTRGLVVVHWSRVVLAGMVSLAFGQMFVTHLTLRLIHFHADRQSAASTGTILKESRMSALNIEGDGRGRARVDDVEGLTLEKNV